MLITKMRLIITFGEKVKTARYKLFLNQKAMAKKTQRELHYILPLGMWATQTNFKAAADFDKLCKEHEIVFNENGITELMNKGIKPWQIVN